jgi:hypothetical protein
MYGLLGRNSSPMLGSNVFSNQSNQVRPQSMNMVGGIDPLRGQSLLGQPMRMPAPSPMALQLQQRMQPQRQGLLGRIGGRVRSAAQEVGGLFEGDEGRARATALSRSLLRGPSRTPISFGQSLAEGLSAGNVAVQQEEERRFKRGLLEREMAAKEAPNVIKMRGPSGADVLVDQSTGKIMSDPFGSQQTTQDEVSSIIDKPISLEEIESAFDLNDAAGGELADKAIRGYGAIASRLTGGDRTPSTSRAVAETNRLNLKMSNAIVQSNGGKRTAAIQRVIDEVTPKTSDTNEQYRAKAKALVAAGREQLERSRQLLIETPKAEDKTKIREGMRELASAVREYEMVLIKDSQRQTKTGIYSPEYKAQKQKSFSEKSNQELFDTLKLGM